MPCPPLNGAFIVTKGKRILLWVGITLVVLAVYVCIFGVQTGFALLAWKWGWQSPVAKITPVDLKDLSINEAPGSRLSYFGYKFEVPWTDLDDGKSKSRTNTELLHFRSGMSIFIGSSVPREFVSEVAKRQGGEDVLRRTYGDEAVASDYNFERAMLAVTPQSVKPFASRTSAVSQALLLLTKSLSVLPPGKSGIFSIRNANFQGFQFGNPAVAPDVVYIKLFDERGALGIVLECHASCSAYPIKQADVNRITQSLVRISTVPGSSNASPTNAQLQESR
jgi:hypothetical protein